MKELFAHNESSRRFQYNYFLSALPGCATRSAKGVLFLHKKQWKCELLEISFTKSISLQCGHVILFKGLIFGTGDKLVV